MKKAIRKGPGRFGTAKNVVRGEEEKKDPDRCNWTRLSEDGHSKLTHSSAKVIASSDESMMISIVRD